MGFPSDGDSARFQTQILWRRAVWTTGASSGSAGVALTCSSVGVAVRDMTSAATTCLISHPSWLCGFRLKVGHTRRRVCHVCDPASVAVVTQRFRFEQPEIGKFSNVFKMRYALLGWLAWIVGKRIVLRKLHVSRR